MADTLERSLESILGQLDDRFEVVLVDDGSSDNSVEIIRSLQRKFSALRLIQLNRDPNRYLGFTRNISIEEAVGKYALLQLDCDDVYGPHIIDFVRVFHQIETCFDHNIYLKGKKINMARRNFLLEHGPYQNVFRGEDRDMWSRFAAADAFLPLTHKSFYYRLPKSRTERVKRAFHHTWDHLKNDFRRGAKLLPFLKKQLAGETEFSKKLALLRCLIAVPAWAAAKFATPLQVHNKSLRGEDFAVYRERMEGTFVEIMQRFGRQADFSDFDDVAQKIFD